MILNKKFRETTDIDSLIEKVYLETKTAFFAALNGRSAVNAPGETFSDTKTCTKSEGSVSASSNYNLRAKSLNNVKDNFSGTEICTKSEKSGMSSSNSILAEMLLNNDKEKNWNTKTCMKSEKSTLNLLPTSSTKSTSESQICNANVHSNESESKVVVQVLPSIGFGDISALSEGRIENGNSKESLKSRLMTFNDILKFENKNGGFGTSRITSPENDVEDDSFSSEYNDEDGDSLSNTSSLFSDHKNNCLAVNKLQSEKSGSKDVANFHKGQDMEISSIKDCKNEKSKPENQESLKSFNGDFMIYPGKGMKLKDIDFISSAIAIAPAAAIRILHYVMFSSYGLIGNEHLLFQTRQNILHFSGFHFDEKSEIYRKKHNCLLNLPYPLLMQIYNILIHSTSKTKVDSVEGLLKFLMKPSGEFHQEESILRMHLKKPFKSDTKNDIESLKKKAMKDLPVVLLRKMTTNFIEKMIHNGNGEHDENKCHHDSSDIYISPSFIHKGSGLQLKCFPEIVVNIENARRRIINLLHCLLYGRPGSESVNRLNILEFSGFTEKRMSFMPRRLFLSRLKMKELLQLCNVLSLHARSATKSIKIKKLLLFLQSPSISSNKRRAKQSYHLKDVDALCKMEESHNEQPKESCQQKVEPICPRQEESVNEQPKELCEQKVEPVCPRPEQSVIGASTVNTEKSKVKLRDFVNICSNVECATPEDLNELNDLLYVKPCDSSEIHHNILEFTPFTFNINSFDFHYRKTLMHYMNINVVRKIARLLDIDTWEDCTSQQDLTLIILKFLMDMKLPDKKRKSSAALKKKKVKSRPHILKFHSYNNNNPQFCKSRSHTPDNFDSNYASEEIDDNVSEMGSPRSVHCQSKSSNSRYRHRLNGFSTKQKAPFNDSTPLLELVHHPTEKELRLLIDRIINSSSLTITMGDLVREVFNCYPSFNLHYRIDFIKSKALEIFQELHQNATMLKD